MRTEEELRRRLEEIAERQREIDGEVVGRGMTDAERDEWDQLVAERHEIEGIVAEHTARREYLASQADKPGAQEAGSTFNVRTTPDIDIHDLSTIRMSVGSPEQAAREMNERAKVAIERSVFHHEDAREDATKARLDKMLRKDGKGALAYHLLRTGSPRYEQAFSKKMAGQFLTHADERELNMTTDGDGGFAVPFTLDPTVVLVSDGSVNPLRAISRTETIIGSNQWQGLTSAGMTASYAAESAEVGDDSPSFAQPTVDLSKAHAFVPFTIELQQDWMALASELAKMFAEAKDDLEAEKFLLGTGSDEPHGLVDALLETPGTFSASGSIVASATGETFAIDDVYALRAALPNRFRANARWLANMDTYDMIRRFSEDDTNDTNVLVDNLRLGFSEDGNIGFSVLGKPAHEASFMESWTTGGAAAADIALAIYGDFSKFLIIDRIGMSIELIPHLFHTGSNRPKGERGFYAHWRNGTGLIAGQAFRMLVIEETS